MIRFFPSCMAGAGKSTVGSALAQELGWALVDSDHLIEAAYGARLQDITDALGKSAFLDTEAKVISAIKANRTVIATGGSVVYRDTAMCKRHTPEGTGNVEIYPTSLS